MSKLIIDKVVKELIQELVGEPGKREPFAETVVNSYLQDLTAQAQLLLNSGSKVEDIEEYYLQELRGNLKENVVEALIKNSEFKDSLYKKSYERLKALGDGSKTYGELFTEFYDEEYLFEIFVRIVEETEGVAITSAKQLQELTGITEIYPEENSTKKEAQATALKQIEETFIKAMSYRYSKALEDILEAGGKYNDLLKVKPIFFNLPETWSGCLTTDKYSSILWAIVYTFLINEPNSTVKPDLKTIAKEIEAPYSVLMDAHKLAKHMPPFVIDINKKKELLEKRLREDIKKYINRQSKEWKKERLLLPQKDWRQENIEIIFNIMIEGYTQAFYAVYFHDFNPVENKPETGKAIIDLIDANKDIIYTEFTAYLEELKKIYTPSF